MTADWKHILDPNPGFREYQVARMLKCSPRTIQRKLAIGEFPPPDYHEQWGKRKIPFWYMATLQAYKASRKITA